MRSHDFVPLALLALVLAGCGGDGAPPADRSSPSPAASDTRPDTSRSGPAFVAVYADGPLEEVRVVRATDGRLVVAGQCAFPEGTRLTVALLNPAGGTQAQAMAGVRVAEGRFMSPPLAGVAGPPPPGVHRINIFARFDPADQDAAVRAASADGRRYHGPGMRTLPDGRIAFETTLEVPL